MKVIFQIKVVIEKLRENENQGKQIGTYEVWE